MDPLAVKTTLFNIFNGQDIGCDLDGMTNSSKFWVTPHGWILVHDTASMSTFLFNPRNRDEKIQLPHLTEDLRRTCACVLSCKPTLPGCSVLLVAPDTTVIWQCCIGGKEWARHEYDIGTQLIDPANDLHEKVPICPIAACRGKFYFNSENFVDIGVLEFSPMPVFGSLKLAGEFEAPTRAKVSWWNLRTIFTWQPGVWHWLRHDRLRDPSPQDGFLCAAVAQS
ncbi:uncharacterized protein LOC121054200 [Oryza brachyantha]|uniref:uncharacterized protein LOC121054200 n=1 Tax=Oryza brachyantha TaxID=4533 RepID=UPI001ADAA1D9|nr:uncharacterized protein LOC121054200 [Oryza brachyantha]